ncbi:hypothetical protein KRZ98_16485 [Sphingobium sp. AS12]|uniref:hypothetical protein n=1 Tax=Sphingobium sp. AS12 TaxID=2849495 RepID=UPI001C3142C4|nr:hypothetical protein [Sphingobium sp. AS12]MBV2149844.1 hypothetical protein [Sphingobium sp. AS12]
MDEYRWPNALPYEPPAPDRATRAFTQLQGELALLRHAIESAPTLQMTPEDFGARFEAAAVMARCEDQAMLAEAKRELTENARSLRATIGTAATIDQQNRNLWRAAGAASPLDAC